VRETADSCVALVAAHFKVANLELVAELRSRAGRLAVQLAIGLIALVGYVLLAVGAAFAAAPSIGHSLAFVLLGAAHLVAAAIAAAVIGLRQRRVPEAKPVIASIGRSVATVAEVVTAKPPAVRTQERPHASA
jgi:hypothetical protein